MPKIESPLTTKTFTASPLPQFDVPDESHTHQPPPDFEAMDAVRQSRGFPPLDDTTKRAMYASMQQESAPSSHQSLHDLEIRVEEARKAKQSGQERLSTAAKARIAALCEMSRSSHSVELDGTSYILQTLKSKEHRAAIIAAMAYDGTPHAAFEVRRQLLARSLLKIGGYDTELFLGDDSIEARLEFMDELPEAVLIKLYSEYLELAQDAQNKYFPQTTEETKEVMDDLKK